MAEQKNTSLKARFANLKSDIHCFSDVFVGDRILWIVFFLLSAISLVSVYSSSILVTTGGFGGSMFLLMKQFGMLLIGAVITVAVALITVYATPGLLKGKMFFVYLFALILLVLTFVPGFRIEINGAARWINFFGLTIQPSEFAKLALILYLSEFLTKDSPRNFLQEDSSDAKIFMIKVIVIVGLVMLLIVFSNFSTALFIAFIAFVMLVLARIKIKKMLVLMGIVGALGGVMFVLILTCPEPAAKVFPRLHTWHTRVVSFLPVLEGDDVASDTKVTSVDNYQVTQAKKAIKNGGIVGQGPGRSLQRHKLSQAYCDFIYAIIIEEYGWVGAVTVILLYMALLVRVPIIQRKSKYLFDTMVVYGLTIMMVSQAFIHMCVVVNVLPATGQTLPVISAGGTSLFITCMEFGLIIGICEYTKRKFDSETTKKEEKEINKNIEANESVN